MKNVITSAVGLAASLVLSTGIANASIFAPSSPGPIDFGLVEVGSSKTISWSIDVTLQSNQSLGFLPIFNDGTFSALQTNDAFECDAGKCTYDFSFAPSLTGHQDRTLKELIIAVDRQRDSSTTFNITLIGVGTEVGVVPLPATMSLMVGGLGLLALGRRMRRKTS